MDQAAGDSTTGAGQASPALARMMVGRRLGWHRAECGLSVDEAAGAAGLPAARILAIEGGQARLKLREVGALCSLYEFSDVEEFADLLGLARSANGPEWWHPYRDVIPAWFTHYLSLEQAASLIRSYEPQVIPGLLQTPGYARAILALGHHGRQQDLMRRVELRLRRQEILRQPRPARLWAVIDEAALRRPAGGTAVMREQIQHLITMGAQPHVTIAVLPFTLGGHLATAGPISLLRLPGPQIPDVVYLEQLTSGLYPGEAESTYYWHILNLLAIQAESAGPAEVILHGVLQDMIMIL